MQYVVMGARILLGLLFFLFGANSLLHFMKMPMPEGDAGTWMTIMFTHHWMNFVGVEQLVSGLLLMVGRFVPLGIALAAPVIVNILLYHALLWPHGYGLAVVAAVLEVVLLAAYWRSFAPLFHPDPRAKRAEPLA